MTGDPEDRTAGTIAALGADDLDGIPPDIARRLLRAFNQSPSTWISLIEGDLTTRFIGRSARWIQGYDPAARQGKKSLDRLHPDDIGPLLHALEQLQAASPQDTPTVPVVEPLRYRLKRLDGPGWLQVEAMVINLLDDPVTQGLVLISRLLGGEMDGVDNVLDKLVRDAPLEEVLAGCAWAIPDYLGSAAIVAFVGGRIVTGAPAGSVAARLCEDERWWQKAVSEQREFAPVDFAGFPADLAERARAEGFRSAWVIPLFDTHDQEVIGCLVVWVRIAVELNVGIDPALRRTARLASLVIGEQRTTSALRHEAHTDPLTGVGNRSALRRRLDDVDDEVTMAVLDLDGFKPVNDTYGHDTGDVVLQIVAQRITAAVREDDLVVRLGGDEFAVVFDGDGDSDGDSDGGAGGGIERTAERLTAAIGEPMQLPDGPRITIGASVGLATGAPGEVVHTADAALYDVKRARSDIRR